jgi:isocitrate dehydrogenase
LSCLTNTRMPFIEGDGTCADIWGASVRMLDAAVAKACGGKRKSASGMVLCGSFLVDELDDLWH